MKVTHEKTSAEKLGEIISRMKWTQADLAAILGVGQKTMSFWLREIKNPGPANQRKIDLAHKIVSRGDLDGKSNAKELLKAEVERMQPGGKDKSTTEGNAVRNKISVGEYFKLKEYVFGKEKENLSKVYLFPSTGGNDDDWYKVGGRSLLFYKFFLAERLNRQVTTRVDTDTHLIFKNGVGSVRRGSDIISQAINLGYGAEKLENGAIVIDLGREFSRTEIKNFIEREKAERQIVENILKPKLNYPKIAMAIRVLAEYLSQKVEQIKKENRETIGRQLIEPAIELVKLYYRMANGHLDKADAKREMLSRADDIAAVIVFMDAGRILEFKARTRLGENILEVRHQIEETL